MNKEEILAKSREDNQNEDEREKQLRKSSAIPAFIAMGVTMITLMLLEMFLLDTELLTNGVSLTMKVVLAVQDWYLAITLKKKWWFVAAILFTFSAVLAILQMIDVFTSMM